ncbi:MAG: hypothetical protein OEV06_12375, partial [Anaerolineae bacterium]|nr:hypothetical protein [Anaerolineae bacterium]
GENFAEGSGLLRFDDKPLIHWLPLLPVLVGGLYKITGIDTLIIALGINFIAYGAIVYLMGNLFYRSLRRDALWFYTGSLLAVTSVSFLSLGTNFSTDILFIIEFLIFITLAQNYIAQPKRSTLMWMGTAAAFSTFTRYSGAVLVLAGAVFVAIVYWKKWREMVVNGVVFGAIAGIPITLWVLLRNMPLTGTPAGGYDWKNVFILENIKFSFARMSQWLLPYEITSRFPSVVLLLLVGLISGIGIKRAWKPLKERLSTAQLIPVWVMTILYFPFVQLTSVTHDHIAIYDDRYQLPLFGLIAILILVTLSVIWSNPENEKALIRRRAFQLIMLIWLLYPIYSVYSFTRASYSQGVIYYNQYNLRAFRDTHFAESLQAYEFPTEARIYSNMSEGVYLLTRQQVYDSFYDTTAGFAGFATSEYLEANHAAWEWGEPAYLVWFKPNEKNYYFTPEQLGAVFQMVLEFSMDGGHFFRVANR